MDTSANSTPKKNAFTKVLSYQIDESLKKKKYDCYLEPLFWFIKRYTGRNTPIKMKDIAPKIGLTPSGLSKIVNAETSQHRSISEADIETICATLGFPLSSILFFYERKEVFDKITKKRDFIKLTNILAGDYEEILNSNIFSSDSVKSKTSIIDNSQKKQAKPDVTNQVNLEPLTGNWYFYVPSSESSIIYNREKNIAKTGELVIDDPEIAELYRIYSPDHIYCGKITIEPIDGKYQTTLKYMTNPNTPHILEYTGTISCPVDNFSVFGALENSREKDLLYLIMSKPSSESQLKFALASALMLSRHEDQEHHRPCSLRMILSREYIEFDSQEYKVLISNLMMNDAVIRIDEEGYNILRQNQEKYDSPALDFLFEMYPNISDFIPPDVTVNKCAFIEEGFLDTLKKEHNKREHNKKKESEKRKKLTSKDMLYLEALLRRHSIAPWYSKTKAVKVNKALKAYSKK